MQKIITCFSVLFLVNAGLKAQTQFMPAKKEISVTSVGNPAKKSAQIYSDFIAVRSGDKITLKPNFLKAPKQPLFLKGLLKSAGSFILVQQVNKTISNNSNKAGNNATPKTDVLPAVGIGVVAGLPNIVQGLKSKKTYLVYSLYDVDKTLLTSQKIKLTKQNSSITFDDIDGNGFVKVVLLSNKKNIIKGDITITIEAAKINGGIAENFNLNSFGDCNGGGDEGKTCLEKYQIAVQKCKDSKTVCYGICAPLSPIPQYLCHLACDAIYDNCHDAAEVAFVKCVNGN